MTSHITFNDFENNKVNKNRDCNTNTFTKYNTEFLRRRDEKDKKINNPDSIYDEMKYKVNYRNSNTRQNTNPNTNNSGSNKNYIRKGDAEKKRNFLSAKVKK
jgi:hypothetical protein